LSLTPTNDPPAAVVSAAAALLGGATASKWKIASDAEHTVVEVDIGWKRRVVFTLRHGESESNGGKNHTLVGSKPFGMG
jgi:hypothetical protein